jgi:hypothetical protein
MAVLLNVSWLFSYCLAELFMNLETVTAVSAAANLKAAFCRQSLLLLPLLEDKPLAGDKLCCFHCS